MAPENAFDATQDQRTSTTDRQFVPNLAAISPQVVAGTLQSVYEKIAPVWPLQDYVAVNPYAGFSSREFLDTREHLRTLSDLELFMPVDYYRQQYQEGTIDRADIANAVDELVADGVEGAERIDVNQVVAFLKEKSVATPTADAEFRKSRNAHRSLYTLIETVDRHCGSDWNRIVSEEISKQCATHYDRGQASWKSTSQELPLYNAWRNEKLIDRTMEVLGVSGFRQFVRALPHQAEAAVAVLLLKLKIPTELWQDYLLCTALNLPGWSAWTSYQQRQADLQSHKNDDLSGLLAIRLAYEFALSQYIKFHVDWDSVAIRHSSNNQHPNSPNDQNLLRYALLRASEIGFRSQLVKGLKQNVVAKRPHSESDQATKLAQMVFCIDVRSERLRRHLETASSNLDTHGFAGFFGLPIEWVELGAEQGTANVPVLISPQFKVHEQVGSAIDETQGASRQRGILRFLRKSWKQVQSSAVSMFAFVETAGLFYGPQLLARSFGWKRDQDARLDGVRDHQHHKLGPSLSSLAAQGITPSQQVDFAESVLRGIGIISNFAKLVVFCGHGSEVENNPLKAGLDCGACGGHSGEPNARFAARLLNQTHVRQGLAERGIVIPGETQFVAALHNTTTDVISFFDTCDMSAARLRDLDELKEIASTATRQTRKERLGLLPGPDPDDLDRRSWDWSEVRPEWGLAGNAAFIAAPRSFSQGVSLMGRSFLHSYDHLHDTDDAILEQIMTAPVVVANWINMQYYASTVDPIHFGSGNKTVHNVVGQFGVLSGNGGDLMTGLPWQSVHDGRQYQHHPLRLLVVIAAPRQAIENIMSKHENVANLVTNGWVQLLSIEDSVFYRYSEQKRWEPMDADSIAN